MEELVIHHDDEGECCFCTNNLLQFNHDDPDPKTSSRCMRRLFHGACCMDGVHDTEDRGLSLCAFCRHLRLGHLLGCLGGVKLPFDYIRLCAFEDIEKRQECVFCQLLIRSGMPYSYFAGMTPPAHFEGGSLEMSLGSGTIGMRFRYEDGAWVGARQVHFSGEGDKGGSRCKGYVELVSEGWIKEEKEKQDLPVRVKRCRSTHRGSNKPTRLGGYVDWNLLSQWLESCSSGHPRCIPKHFGENPTAFRLIDVHRRCIVPATADFHYVALSYVWGKNPDFAKMTTRATIKALEQEGGLLPTNTPKTINDAIDICRQLKQDYLWVDQYCIIQDNETDKKEQISSMAAIYSCATFVIITTDGVMSDGIPGVSYERPQKQIQRRIAGIDLINTLPSWREITLGGSLWSTRGWTYQEVILGRRRLYFTSSQSFFECDESVLSEDGSTQQALYSPNGLHPQVWDPNVDCYFGHVRKYSARHIGSASDIYNAIEGVASAIYKKKNPLWFGLPRYDFDLALLWCPDAANSRGADRPGLKDVPKELIPSWSWSSTGQSVLLLDDCNRRQIRFCGTLVSWASLQRVGDSHKVESIIPSSGVEYGCPHCEEEGVTAEEGEYACDERYTDEKLLYMAVAWSQGLLEGECPFPSPGEVDFSSLKSSVISRWPCKYRYWKEAFQRQKNPSTNVPLVESLLREVTLLSPPAKPTVIVTRAQSAFFRLLPPTDQSMYLRDYPIIDENCETVGALIGQDPELQATLGADVETCAPLEFLALSVSDLDGIIQPDASTEYKGFKYKDPTQIADDTLQDLTYFDHEGTPLLPLPVVNVMLVRRDDSTMEAHRLSVGWIYMTQWTKANPTFQTVYLG
ncbi:hypothetical protein FE257_000571 [Aspergillus nanangensis]|uniref:Heterokaryon incompatibility domain-containing protein n=1 Tax=Aspergillus nanangensis TaxID=2582783 RepID=A0AAD4GWP0_ASPNN|nr:hypothetical protein FE257_000571 [Aspergillus nanangensis]